MGLANMQPLSDEAGLHVRGKGTFASVWGSSTASWGGQTSSNNYSAGSSWLGKPSGAVGSSFSFAGKFQGFGRFGRLSPRCSVDLATRRMKCKRALSANRCRQGPYFLLRRPVEAYT